MEKQIFECDVGLLIENSISIEQYFVMYYIYTDNYSLLMKYVKSCGKISTSLFKTLVLNGYLEQVENDDFNKDSLRLTDKFELNFIKSVNKIDFETCFQQFWDHYPNLVKQGLDKRYLRVDKEVCKNLYKRIIIGKGGSIDLALHSLILQCINYEVKDKKRGGSMIYMRNSSTWLRNKSWEPYKDEVEKIIFKGGAVGQQSLEEDGDEVI